MLKKKIFGAGAGQSRAFMGGAGAKIFDLEPETKKKISGARAKKNVSAQQHWFLSR